MGPTKKPKDPVGFGLAQKAGQLHKPNSRYVLKGVNANADT